MRHYMVDPDNDQRLLKIPRRVVDNIKAEAIRDCIAAVEALDTPAPWIGIDLSLAAMRALLEGEKA